MNKVLNYIKTMRGNYGSFLKSDIINYYPKTDSKNIMKCLTKLVKTGKLAKRYRVYNSYDSSEYEDFIRKDDIPFGDYAYYHATGKHFSVSKYNPQIDVYYVLER